jgi:alpha-amylase/alpha-mannosidase (GH57 family)
MAAKLDLVFLWHMHQPDYRLRGGDGASGEYVLPWVYLHAIKDYTDMVAHLERHPGVRAVVNFVPTLVEQIEDYVAQFRGGRMRDPLLRLLGERDYAQLSTEERRLILSSCFRCNHPTMLQPFPHYRRLYDLYKSLQGQGEIGLSYLSGSYFSDLITWYHLVWFGECERRRQPVLVSMLAKGEGFDHDDRARLMRLIGEALARLLERYRALASAGQIELSATPYSHPLGPLLLDLKSAREALPDVPLPESPEYPGGRSRFQAQVERALNKHRETFGVSPEGMWPAEGALSAGVLQMLAAAGVRWSASSEGVLANSLRHSHGSLPARSRYAYRPFRIDAAPGITVFFRDERLSDLIGFEYSKWHGRDAAAHFIAQLETIRNQAPADEPPLVCVMLDGENAWEYYPYNGYFFFDDLYANLEKHPDIRTTTFGEYVARSPSSWDRLPSLVAGSWVYGTLSTWVGDRDKNRAWDLLCAAKQSYDRVIAGETLTAAERNTAAEQLAVCESSDWFWWFGDYNPAEAVAGFDRLFRLNLKRLYELLKLPAPADIELPLSRGSGAPESGGTMRRAT